MDALDRIIEMAWEDRTPFEAIEYQFNLKENEVRKIMRSHLSNSSFVLSEGRVVSDDDQNLQFAFGDKILL